MKLLLEDPRFKLKHNRLIFRNARSAGEKLHDLKTVDCVMTTPHTTNLPDRPD